MLENYVAGKLLQNGHQGLTNLKSIYRSVSPFLDKQMWKIVGSTLTDKSNLWSEGFGKIWVIPELGKSGMIENQNDNKTLRIERNPNTETNEVKEGEKDEMDPLQKWERIATDRSDYFLLKNPKSETYLTATINGQLTVDGNTLERSIKKFWGFKQLLL